MGMARVFIFDFLLRNLPWPSVSQASGQYGFHSWQHPPSDHGQTKTNEPFKRFKVGRESDVTFPSLYLPLPFVFILRHFFPSLFFFYILFLHGSWSMLQGKDEFISPLIPFFFSSLTVRFFYNSTPIYISSVR